MRRITQHFSVLASGQNAFAYSSPAGEGNIDIRSRFSVLDSQKILVAAMSSYDEYFTYETVTGENKSQAILYSSQIEWIKSLIEYLKFREDLFLVIRVHPREFPNKREGVKSQHARLLEQEFQNLPSNVAVNWPSDNLSLYDLANYTSVFLSAWSSVGKEMSLLGLPVVIYSKDLISYPDDLNLLGDTSETFFGAIETALIEGWNLERSRQTYRWLALEYEYSTFDMSESIRVDWETPVKSSKSSFFQRAWNRIRLKVDPLFLQKQDCKERVDRLESIDRIERMLIMRCKTSLDPCLNYLAPLTSLEEETSALCRELSYISSIFYGEKDYPPDTIAHRLRQI